MSQDSLQGTFLASASGVPSQAKTGRARSTPFSLRLSERERSILQAQAGSQPLGAYVRNRLLRDCAEKRHVTRRPQLDEQKVAMLLAALGRSRLAANLNQLAKAANMGTLGTSQGVATELNEACRDVRIMKETLIAALGLKVKE